MSKEEVTVHSAIEVEKSLLGYILQNQTLQNIFGYLAPVDFYDSKHQVLFESLTKLSEEVPDRHLEQSILIQYLTDHKLIEKVGGLTYVADLISVAGLEANVPKYIKTIDEKSRLRRLTIDLSSVQKELATKANVSTDELLEKMEMKILSSVRNTEVKGFENAKALTSQALNIIEKKIAGEAPTGIKSDFRNLDEITGGFQRGDLIILAARPSMGKTALALNIAMNIAETQHVAFFSVEMPSVQIINRILSAKGMIDANKIRDPKLLTTNDSAKLYLASDRVQKLKLDIDDTAGIKLTDLIWKAKNLYKNLNSNLALIVIDYLQLITIPNANGIDNRQAEVSQISRTLKKLARELNVPIIALSQLSRKVEQRESKVPMMSDLRESGAIEQDADLIAFVYREEYYNAKKDESGQDFKNATQAVKIIIGKHRNGAIGEVELMFEPKFGLFQNYKKGNR